MAARARTAAAHRCKLTLMKATYGLYVSRPVLGHRRDAVDGAERRPATRYNDGVERGREGKNGSVPEDQQLTRSTESSTARRGEVGDDGEVLDMRWPGLEKKGTARSIAASPRRFLWRGGRGRRGGDSCGLRSALRCLSRRRRAAACKSRFGHGGRARRERERAREQVRERGRGGRCASFLSTREQGGMAPGRVRWRRASSRAPLGRYREEDTSVLPGFNSR